MAKVAVVIGAGPVGALAAVVLAERGFDVQVFEKRSAPKRVPEPGNTSAYLMNVNARGLRAMELVGLDYDSLIPQHNGKLAQNVYSPSGGVMRKYVHLVPASKPGVLRVFRDEIAALLVSEAKHLHPERITFTFGIAATDIDLDQQLVDLSSQDKLSKQVHYDLLVGADGAGSVVRQALQKRLPEGFVDRIRHDIVYTGETYANPPTGEFPEYGYFDTHFFSAGVVTVSGNLEVEPRLMLFLDISGAEQVRKGEAQWLLDMVDAELPRLSPGAKGALKRVVATKPKFSTMSGWTTLSQLHGPKVVLLGDASHTVTPILGQGCNAGLEDVAVLAGILDKHDGNLDAALPAYTKARLPDAKALVKLNMIAAQERASVHRSGAKRGHQLWLAWHGLVFHTHLALHTSLHRLSPRLFKRPAFTRAVLGEVPYRAALCSMYWDVAGIVAAAGAITIPLLARKWKSA